MDLNHLDVFATVAEAASFTEAARRLGLPKATVSRAVASLEASLGVRLLQRTTRSVAPTTAGLALVGRVGPRLKALKDAIDDVPELADEPSGALRLTATSDFGTEMLAEVLAGFCRRYPRITVEMHLSNRSVDLVKERFDAAFRLLNKRPRDSALVARKLGELSLQYYASPEYLLSRGTPKALEELAAHDGVELVEGERVNSGASTRERAQLRKRLVTDDGFFAREAVRQGMGIGLLPAFLVNEDVRLGRLVRVLPRVASAMGGVFLMIPHGQHIPRKVTVLRAHVIEALRARFNALGAAR